MSRQVPFYVPLFLCATIVLNTKCVDSLADRCLELVKLDIGEIEDHLSKLELTDVPTVKMMVAGFKCPISALPFGALKSDWSRLLLLREAQPDGSVIKQELVRLARLLIIAYYEMEERFDAMRSDTQIPEQPPMKGTITTALAANKPDSSSGRNCSWTFQGSKNDAYQHAHSPPIIVPIAANDRSTGDSASTRKTEAAMTTTARTIEQLSSSEHRTTGVVPFVTTHRELASPTFSPPSVDLSAVTAPYSTARRGTKYVVSVGALGDCLKQPLQRWEVARLPANRTRDKQTEVFERLKSKKRVLQGATSRWWRQQRNGINDRGKNGTITKISPPANDFWRYVAYPTAAPAPLTISAIARGPYRARGLNGFGTNPRKSRRRATTNGRDVHESPGRAFYDVDKNKVGTKRNASDRSDIAIERTGEK